MAIFSVSPTIGQEETVLGRTFVYDGDGWVAKDTSEHTFAPSVHNHDDLYFTESEVTSALSGKVNTDDARLTDSRTPLAHKTSHATAGADALRPDDIIPTLTTATAAATAAKVITSAYQPVAGDLVRVVFTSGNSASTATLNVNGTGAKNIRIANASATNVATTTAAGGMMFFYFDGTYYHLLGSQRNSDTTVSVATGAEVAAGTENTKFASAKAIKDSVSVPVVVPGTAGNVIRSTGTAWASTALAISDVANLQTTLDGKASTAVATTTVNGLMAYADKLKLDGIAANANNYSHPTNHPASIITQDSNNRFVTDALIATWNGKANAAHTHAQANIDSAAGWISTALAGKQAAGSYLTTTGQAFDSARLGGVVAGSYSQTSHNHGLVHTGMATYIPDTIVDSGWSMINSPYYGFILKSLKTEANAPDWILGNFSAGVAFGGGDTKGVISVAYGSPIIRVAGGNG